MKSPFSKRETGASRYLTKVPWYRKLWNHIVWLAKAGRRRDQGNS